MSPSPEERLHQLTPALYDWLSHWKKAAYASRRGRIDEAPL